MPPATPAAPPPHPDPARRSGETLAGAALVARLRREAAGLGFDALGIAPAALPDETRARLAAFLAAGRHGDMTWMAAGAERRGDPRALWPQARSAVLLGVCYAPEADPLAALARRAQGAISIYAARRDYHDVLKTGLRALTRTLVALGGGDAKLFVDTAPLMEKPLAQRAGLGWQGKHTNLVSRRHGSWLFLGAILTTLDLPQDAAHADRCGTCTRCLDICPTAAFPAPYQLDARRCIAYLTIEHKGHIPAEFRAPIGNRIFGCDDCLAVCPWNKFAVAARAAALAPRPSLDAPSLASLAALDDTAFRALFAGTPIKRTGRDRFLRNVLIAIGNSGQASLAPAAEARLGDPSPLVRAMAVWALARLLPSPRFAALRAVHRPAESDPAVASEWDPRTVA
jgi:epoxyqueuosine reductase